MTTCARNRNVRELPPRKPHSSHRRPSPPCLLHIENHACKYFPLLLVVAPLSRPPTPHVAHGTPGWAKRVPLKHWKKAWLSRSPARLMRVSFVTLGPEFSTSARRSTSRKRRVRSRFTGRVSYASIASSTFCRKFSANLVLLCSAPYVCRARSADQFFFKSKEVGKRVSQA